MTYLKHLCSTKCQRLSIFEHSQYFLCTDKTPKEAVFIVYWLSGSKSLRCNLYVTCNLPNVCFHLIYITKRSERWIIVLYIIVNQWYSKWIKTILFSTYNEEECSCIADPSGVKKCSTDTSEISKCPGKSFTVEENNIDRQMSGIIKKQKKMRRGFRSPLIRRGR